MQKKLLFLFLIFTVQNIFTNQNNFSEPDLINRLNMVGPHPQSIEMILKLIEQGLDIDSRFLLLYGLPGTGKTKYALELARVAEGNVIKVSGSDLINRYIGTGASGVRDVFHQAKYGGDLCPGFDRSKMTFLIFDEVDAFANKAGDSGEYHLASVAFWTKMDEVINDESIFIIMTTNNRESIPKQVLDRLSTLQEKFELPDKNKRKKLFERYLAAYPDLLSSCSKFADKSDGFSSRTVESICRDAIQNSRAYGIKVDSKVILSFLEKYEKIEAKGYLEWLGHILDDKKTKVNSINELAKFTDSYARLGAFSIAIAGGAAVCAKNSWPYVKSSAVFIYKVIQGWRGGSSGSVS